MVVPARNEERFIDDCLHSVLSQTYSNLEVIVVDGASTDATPSLVRAHVGRDPRVSLLENPAGTIPKSLNLALGAARGRWLVRVDAHSTVLPDYVSRAIEHLRTGRWGGVGGRKDGVGVTPAGRAIAAAMASRFGVGNSVYHHGTRLQTVDHVAFGAYPVALVRRLGGWDERLLANEDFEFDHRVHSAGHQLLFDPALLIRWHCRQSIGDLFRQYRRYGRAKVEVLSLHPDSARPRHLAVPALVLFAAATGIGAVARPRLAAKLLGPYVFAVAAASAATASKVDGEARPFVPAAFAAMHFGWGVGFWQGVAAKVVAAAPRREAQRLRESA